MSSYFFFFFNDTATTEIYTLSLHDALPISHYFELAGYLVTAWVPDVGPKFAGARIRPRVRAPERDRKSTRLNSSHGYISYAVFCLKKKKRCHRAHSFPRYLPVGGRHHEPPA